MVKADPVSLQGAPDGDRASASEPDSDPFTRDLFASGRERAPNAVELTEGPGASATSQSYNLNWHARLPRLSPAQARLSSALTNLIPDFSGRAGVGVVRRALARYLRVELERFSVSTLDVREREFDSGRASTYVGPRMWATLSVAPSDELIAVEIEADFAATLIERALGGEGARPETLRELSPTEQAVGEFLWLALLHELNAHAEDALWRLESVTTRPPAWLGLRGKEGEEARASAPAPVDDENRRGEAERLLVATVRVEVGAAAGVASFHLTRRALDALGAAHNPLARRATRPGREASRLERLRLIAPDVALRPVVGETDVLAAALAQLETGDVVVVSRPAARLGAGGWLSGVLGVRVGDGRGVVLTGTIETSAAAGTIALLVETIRGGGRAPATEHMRMTEERGNEVEDEGAVALGELWLTLSVELAARRVSLEELSRLRAGQLLELGCRATDPVELVVDGRTVARGELVDLEGQLGVHITQLTG